MNGFFMRSKALGDEVFTILNHYELAKKEHFVSLKLEGQSGARTRDLRHPKQAALTTAPRPPPSWGWRNE